MNFSEALVLMRQGKKMKQKEWENGFYIEFEQDMANTDGRGNLFFFSKKLNNRSIWVPLSSELTVNAWEEIK